MSDPDGPTLSPTEELICEVLAARHRLGEPFWPIPARNLKALNALVEKGLVSYFDGWTSKDRRAKLTPAGREAFLKADYVAPILDPNCRSFYIGPASSEFRVDCDRLAHGPEKKHRHRYPKSLDMTPVKWTDAEAGGFASARYGDLLRNAAETA